MKLPFRFLGTAALLALALSSAARADELKLKDGTKISGTIIGFEENSFKVKTSYGYAVVQKDQVVSISVSDAAKTAPPDKKPEPAVEKAPVPEKPKPESANAAASSPPAPVPSQPAAPVVKPAAPPPPAPTVAATAPPPAIPAPAADAALPKPPAPEPIREAIVGNLYTNETYGFQMYKPPAWELIAGARKVLPGAVTAMGTYDETTYLLIGQQPAGKSLATDMDATERRLRDVMDNFRPLGEEHVTISGAPAVEHHFRGSVDQHDWSGVVVVVAPRGSRLYTIFGMTRADDDLVQIQENVIARAISSLQFMEQ
ncbi:MAG: hypothetical protein ABR953_05495 [Candidatus Acidiferrales bacterium]